MKRCLLTLVLTAWLGSGLLACGSSGSSEPGDTDIPGADTGADVATDAGIDVTAPDTGRPDVLRPDVPIEPGAFGYPCSDNIECDSGFCVEGPDGFFCTALCVENCPEGFSCKSFAFGGDVVSLCMPNFVKACALCSKDSQCNGGRCLQNEGAGHCFPPCDADDTCAIPGFECVEAAVGEALEKVCMPKTGSCSCIDATQGGDVRTCSLANEHGTCYGVETCDATAGWIGCSATLPAPEVCDGFDQNCNGRIDEDLPEARACEVRVEGIGTCIGQERCMGALGWICDARTPTVEICDGFDNNCDGVIDEGFQVGGVYGDVAHCGACGRSCVGVLPNAAERCDTEGAEGPRCVVDQCDPGYFQVNATQCFGLQSVLCQPCNRDEDCVTGHCVAIGVASYCTVPCGTNVPPEGYDCAAVGSSSFLVPSSGACGCTPSSAGQTRSCFATNAVGTCYGFETCDPDAGWVGCTASAPAAEICNGLDDDCDGVVDNGVAVGESCEVEVPGVGTCTGVTLCRGPLGMVCTASTPSPEVCNYVDDDCNGLVDDGFVTDGLYVTDENCGVCGNDCARAIVNGTGRCAVVGDAARCVVDFCQPGFQNIGGFLCLEAPDVVCSPCTADAQCLGGVCATIGDGQFCTRECDIDTPCPDGTECQVLGEALRCLPPTGSCDCTVDLSGEVRLCRVSNDAGTCYGTEACNPDAGGWGGCDAATPMAEVCNGLDDDCNGLVDDGVEVVRPCEVTNAYGTCVGVEFCTEAGYSCNAPVPTAEVCDFLDNNCDGVVDEGFTTIDPESGLARYSTLEHCGTCGNDCATRIFNGTAQCDLSQGFPRCVVDSCNEGFYKLNEFQCILAPDVTCRPCDTDGQCFGGFCGVLDGRGYCLAPCGDGVSCVAGQICQELPDGRSGCVPATGTCDCDASNAGAKRACSRTNGFGTCMGFQTCDALAGWSACDAAVPSTEVCDGIDNDCNGFIDDALPESISCERTNTFGSCAGEAYCYGRLGWVCQAEAAKAEVCDYQDNDCDGVIDNGFVDGEGRYTSYQHCGSCGVSCGQGYPNAVTVCDPDGLLPMCKVESCDPGYFKLNDFQCIPNVAKLCEPCLVDANCIVEGARCVPLGNEGSFCGLPCEVQADCDSKVQGYVCTSFGTFSQCLPATGSCSCDGTNPGLEKACSTTYQPQDGTAYTCYGKETCTPGGWSGCVLPTEVCNLIDDDCNGLTDEGFVDDQGEYRSDRHCGGCGNDCTLLVFGNATGVCNTTVEPVRCGPQCEEGYFDLDFNPNDCECHKLSEEDWPGADFPQYPDDLDVNCDGVDGDVTKAIFVARNGDDAWPGTREEPKRTVQAGIVAAFADGKRDVYVATGVYREAIVLAPGIGVYGGYSADFRVRDTARYESAVMAPAPVTGRPGAVNAIGISGGLPGTTVFDGFTVFAFDERRPGMSSYGVYLRNSDMTVRISNNVLVGGSGGPGARGADGIDGANGVAGQPGTNALDVLDAFGVAGHCTSKTQYLSPGGAFGAFQCGGVNVSGGLGGNRTCPQLVTGSNDTPEPPVASEFGAAGLNNLLMGAGGTPGRDVYHQSYSCDGYSTLGAVEGGNGLDGDTGTNGVSGNGCRNAQGTVNGGVWVPLNATAGTTGIPGGGGGGGGSGGGAWSHTSCNSKGFGWDNFGGTGGGGGSGGCQGTAGQPGTGAGGAFTVFVVFESAPLTVPWIEGNEVAGGVGGPGGAGGNGGVGGAGGAGALGGAAGGGYSPPSPTYPAFQGGKGGSGGRGGHGGGGGGGCGGPAFGIFATGATGVDLSDWRLGNQFTDPGEGGEGGLGGFSLGNPGGDGVDGIAAHANF